MTDPTLTSRDEASPAAPAGSYWVTFRWATEGILYTWRTQRNMKVHVAISAAVVAIGLWLRLPARDWAVLALTIGVVLAAETGNTALEAMVDLASPDVHPLAKIAKDAAAGTVFILALAAVAVGLAILGPPLWVRLFAS